MTEELHNDSCLLSGPEYPEEALSVDAADSALEAKVSEDTLDESKAKIAAIPPLKWAGILQARAVSAVPRDPKDISHIVLHTPEGYEQGTLDVLNGTRAGFDYFLPLSGNLYNTNNWYRYIAWQAGDGIQREQSYGYHSIGIEQGDFAANARGFGEAHYRRLAHLCAWLQSEHLPSVQVRHETARGQSGGGYIYHRTVTPGLRTDPGNFPMDDFLSLVSGFLRGSEHEPEPPSNTLHRVQSGAFGGAKNARRQGEKVKRQGFEYALIYENGLFKIQHGAFSSKTNATGLERALERKGFDAFVTSGKAEGGGGGGEKMSTREETAKITGWVAPVPNFNQWTGNARRLAQAIWNRFGVEITTYAGHGAGGDSRTAIDCWVAPAGQWADAAQRALGNEIWAFVVDAGNGYGNWNGYGVSYMIFLDTYIDAKTKKQYSGNFNYSKGSSNRITWLHGDHNHISCN